MDRVIRGHTVVDVSKSRLGQGQIPVTRGLNVAFARNPSEGDPLTAPDIRRFVGTRRGNNLRVQCCHSWLYRICALHNLP